VIHQDPNQPEGNILGQMPWPANPLPKRAGEPKNPSISGLKGQNLKLIMNIMRCNLRCWANNMKESTVF